MTMTGAELSRFLEEPGAHLILNPDLTIYLVGQEFARITRLPRNAEGQSIFRAYSGPKDSVEQVLESLTRVKQTGEPDKMEMEMLCVRVGEEDEERYLRITNIPVFDEARKLNYIVHRIEDFSQFWEMRKWQIANHKKTRRYIAILFMVAVFLMGLITLAYTASRRRIDAVATGSCVVQQRSLPAQRHLAAVMHDIRDVLAFPQPPDQGIFFRSLPKAQQLNERGKLKDLNDNLTAFYTLTYQQPATRKC